MLHSLKIGIGAWLGLWKGSAEEMLCYSTAYNLTEEREGEGEGGQVGYRSLVLASFLLSDLHVSRGGSVTSPTFMSKAFEND